MSHPQPEDGRSDLHDLPSPHGDLHRRRDLLPLQATGVHLVKNGSPLCLQNLGHAHISPGDDAVPQPTQRRVWQIDYSGHHHYDFGIDYPSKVRLRAFHEGEVGPRKSPQFLRILAFR